MSVLREEERWEVLEKIGAYAAGELEGEEAREVEQLIFERLDYRLLAESYARMLVMLTTLRDEEVEAPEQIVGYVVRRACVSAFLRQAEQLVHGLVRDYSDALAFYLGLRSVQPQ